MKDISRRLFLKLSGGCLVASQVIQPSETAAADLARESNTASITISNIEKDTRIAVFRADTMKCVFNEKTDCDSSTIYLPRQEADAYVIRVRKAGSLPIQITHVQSDITIHQIPDPVIAL